MEEHEEKRKEAERLRYREFTVTPGMVGFKVKIGGSETYFSDAGSLAVAIGEYLEDPDDIEARYRQKDQRYGMLWYLCL